jgi:nitrate reductase beta subunit
MTRIYYTPPVDEVFNEVKAKAIELWREIAGLEQPGVEMTRGDLLYLEEKLRIKDFENVGDNLMTIVAMFDYANQAKLSQKISEASRIAIRTRMIDGGQPGEYIYF